MLAIFELLIKIGIYLIIFALSSIPLFLSVKALKGKTTFGEVILVNIIAAVIIAVVNHFAFIWGGILAFILILLVYKAVFEFGWGKALLAWFLQFVIVAILIAFVLAVEFLLGMGLMLI